VYNCILFLYDAMTTVSVLKYMGKVKAHIAAVELDLLLSDTGVCLSETQPMYGSATPHEDLYKLRKLLVDYQKALK